MPGKKFIPYILLMPLLIFYILPLTASIINMIIQSLGYFPALNMNSIKFEYIIKVFKDRVFIDSLYFSIYFSLIATLLAIILGFSIAYSLYYSKNMGRYGFLLKTPIIIPHFTAAFMVYIIFSQSGFFSRLFGSLNIINSQRDFFELILDKRGIGIILAYVWKEVPFSALVFYNSIKMIGNKFKEPSENLGASEAFYIKNVLIPLCLPSIASTFAILFGYNFGAFEVPYLLGPSYPKALPVLGYISYLSSNMEDRPYSMAVNTIITFMSFLLLIIYNKAAKTMKQLCL